MRTLTGLFILIPLCFSHAQQPFCSVTVSNGLVYGAGAVNETSGGGGINLLGDMYLPTELSGVTKPALLLVHGGSFQAGTRNDVYMTDAAQYYAQRGFVCFSIDYRLEGNDPPAPDWIDTLVLISGDPTLKAVHAAATDTKKALRWLRANAGVYGIDTGRVATVGVSAGAFCALMANVTDPEDFANDEGTAIPDSHPTISGQSDACIEIFGDMGIWADDFDSADPPIMIVHGTADAVVPFSSAEAIRNECVSNNIPHAFYPIPGGGHDLSTWHATVDGVWIPEHGLNFLQQHMNLLTTNGTPQLWLERYGVADTLDDDGDGHAAWQEYRAGTLPDQTASALSSSISYEGQLEISWASVSGKTYRVWSTANLLNQGTVVVSNHVATAAVSVVEFEVIPPRQYYSIEVQ